MHGEWLADLPDEGRALPLATLLRILLDVLDALTTIHALPDVRGEAQNVPYGVVGPAHVLVGVDGVARLAHPLGSQASPSSQWNGYAAPEILLRDQRPDARADMFSVGVMLWE